MVDPETPDPEMSDYGRNVRKFQKMERILTVSGREIKFLKVHDDPDANSSIEVFIYAIEMWQNQGYDVKIHVLKLRTQPDENEYHYKYAALFIKNNVLEQVYLHQNYTMNYTGSTHGFGMDAYEKFEAFLELNREIQTTRKSYEWKFDTSSNMDGNMDDNMDESRIIEYLEQNDYLL